MNISETHHLLDRTVMLIKTYLEQVHTQQRKVVNFHHPEQLKQLFDFSLHDEGIEIDEVIQRMQDIADYSVANQHPRFFSALRGGADIYGIVGERLTAVMGTTMYTYEVAPLFTLMEEFIFNELATYLGWSGEHDGMMLPGGATCNLYGLQLARYALDPHINTAGMYAYTPKPLVVFTSDQSHYSITKAAMLMGIGKDHVIKVATNEHGEMFPDALEKSINTAIDDGKQPVMINATAGTTVFGAYDPLDSIAEIAKKHKIWFHVDAIWGGGVLLHDNLRYKIQGIERADSRGWNPHKMMGAPIQCSIFMTQHADKSQRCNSLRSRYLFNDDKVYDACYDTGDKYLQCGRRVDVVKLRLQRKARGKQGIADNIALAFDNVSYLTQKIKQSEHLMMIHSPDCLNVCFWYLPDHVSKNISIQEIAKQYYDEIHMITAKIHAKLLQTGAMMTMFTNAKGLPNFFRLAIVSPNVTHQDLDFVVEHITTLGKQIEEEQSSK